jgi:hypothetical protein
MIQHSSFAILEATRRPIKSKRDAACRGDPAARAQASRDVAVKSRIVSAGLFGPATRDDAPAME